MYIQIARSEEYTLLIKTGTYTKAECFEAWEKILQRQSKLTGDFTYINYLDTLKQLWNLIRNYNIIQACLIKLQFMIDLSMIKYLAQEGYEIKNGPDGTIALSLKRAFQKSKSFLTKIETRQKQLKDFGKTSDGDSRDSTVADIIAPLVLNGANVDEDISLSMFNAINKTIKRQNGTRNR